MIKKFKSKVDGLEFIYQIVDGQLSYKIEGTDWQDFILEDKSCLLYTSPSPRD